MRITAGLTLTVLLLASFTATAIGMSGAASACASSPDPMSCYKNSASGTQSSGEFSLSNTSPSRPSKSAESGALTVPPRQVIQHKTNDAPMEVSEFQTFVATSAGKNLPIFGYDLFGDVPDTFAPLDNVPVTPDYLIGPGDELILKGWGQVDIDVKVVVNRNGAINLPKVGTVNVAGVRYEDLRTHLKAAIAKVFRNFELNVSLGELRTIQVFVLGQAKRPGVYTVSSLSSLVNTLFASGGPSSNGSLRHIQVKRNGKLVTEFDMYELLLHGDKTKDVALLSGDVIYIPAVGQQVAIYGSIRNPAIYELINEKTTLSDVLELSGGVSTTSSARQVLLERIQEHKVRKVEELSLDVAGLVHSIRDGDLIKVFAVESRFDNAVTLRGNVSSPGRYPWKDGMRLTDLIPDVESLIVPEYWAKQNLLVYSKDSKDSKDSSVSHLQAQIKQRTADINWDYAIVERLNKVDLTTQLFPFNLGEAIGNRGSEQNLLLQSGDTIRIFSKADIQVPIAKRGVYVRLEGEVNNAGVYKALPGETLRQLLARVGGLTADAYLFASEFYRESVRELQQKKLTEMADKMEEAIQRNLTNKVQASLTPADIESNKAQAVAQAALVARMRKAQATGRIVLEVPTEGGGLADLPDLVLDDGDRFAVPAKPAVVNVMGMVYNENAFMYRAGKSVSDYLAQAGGTTRDADASRMYVLRADGSVLSAQNSVGLFGSSFSRGTLMPGDAVVVPEMMDKFYFTKELKDWAQIFYQFALGVGSIKLLKL